MRNKKLFTIRLTQEQYALLKKLSYEYGMTMKDLIVTKTLTDKELKKIKKEESDLCKVMKRQDQLEKELKFIRQSLNDLSKLMEATDERPI